MFSLSSPKAKRYFVFLGHNISAVFNTLFFCISHVLLVLCSPSRWQDSDTTAEIRKKTHVPNSFHRTLTTHQCLLQRRDAQEILASCRDQCSGLLWSSQACVVSTELFWWSWWGRNRHIFTYGVFHSTPPTRSVWRRLHTHTRAAEASPLSTCISSPALRTAWNTLVTVINKVVLILLLFSTVHDDTVDFGLDIKRDPFELTGAQIK